MRKVQRELDPVIVETKMKEYRRDPEAFFERYGGGPSLGYDLIDKHGRSYPPAAIVQAALGWEDVKGGAKARDSAGRALRLHGFRVVKKGKRLSKRPTNLDEATKRLRKIVETEKSTVSKRRVGSGALRKFALKHKVACEVTGLSDDALLRVSHIVAWSDDEKNRLNPENIVLLSALWDSAFDQGLVSFDEAGAALFSPKLSKDAKAMLVATEDTKLSLSAERKQFLAMHRKRFGFK